MLRGPVSVTPAQRSSMTSSDSNKVKVNNNDDVKANDSKAKVINKENVQFATFTEQNMLNALMDKSPVKPTAAGVVTASNSSAVRHGLRHMSSISSSSSDSESNAHTAAGSGMSSVRKPSVQRPTSSQHQQLQVMMSKRTRSYSSGSSQSQTSNPDGFVMVTDFEDDDEAGDSVRSHQLDSGYPSDVTTRGAGGVKTKVAKSHTASRNVEGLPHSDEDEVKVKREVPPAKPRRTTAKTQSQLTIVAVVERHDTGSVEPIHHDRDELQLPSKTERLMGIHTQSSSSTINVDGDDERENTTDNDASCFDSDFDDISLNTDLGQQRQRQGVASRNHNNNNNKNGVELTVGRLGTSEEAATDKTDAISLGSFVNIEDDVNGDGVDVDDLVDDQLPATAIERLLTDLMAKYGSLLGDGKNSKTSPAHEQSAEQLENGPTAAEAAHSGHNQVKDIRTTPHGELNSTTPINNNTNISGGQNSDDKEARSVRDVAAATATAPSPPTSARVSPKVVNVNNAGLTSSPMTINKDNRMEFRAEISNGSSNNNNNIKYEQPTPNSYSPATTSAILQQFLSAAAEDDDDDILSAISEEPDMPEDVIVTVTSAGRHKHDDGSRRASTSTLGEVNSCDFDDEDEVSATNDVTVIHRDRLNDVGTANDDGINNNSSPVSPTTTREADLLVMQYFCLPVHEDEDERTSSTIKSDGSPTHENTLPTLSERVRANALYARDSLEVHPSDVVDSWSAIEEHNVSIEGRPRTYSNGLKTEEPTSAATAAAEIKQLTSSETVLDKNVDKQPTTSDVSKQPIASDVSDVSVRVNNQPIGLSRYVSENNLQSANSISTTNLERDVSSSVMSVYSGAGGYETTANIPITGDIQLTLSYDERKSSLRLLVHQCRHLAVADTRKRRTDPYVKAYLLPDKTRSGKRKTKCKKNTLSPVYNETLSFPVEKSQLPQRTLYVSVWHRQTLGHNEFLGETTIRLDTLDISQQQQQSASWYTLKDSMGGPLSSLTYRGELHVTLTFVSTSGSGGKRDTDAGDLYVKLQQARGLLSLRPNGSADAFCTGRLLNNKTGSSKQKTPVIKRDTNPQWQCELVFKSLTLSQLRERALELCVWDHDLLSNDFLGGTRLGLGTGKSNGRAADWNDARGEEVGVWQAMLDQPNTPSHSTLLLRPHMNPRPL